MSAPSRCAHVFSIPVAGLTLFLPKNQIVTGMMKVVRSARDKMATVDSTPIYTFYPLVPFRMKMVLPRAKLIIILRDPTER